MRCGAIPLPATLDFAHYLIPGSKVHMAGTEMSLSARGNRDQSADEVYDDGHLRVEHQNY